MNENEIYQDALLEDFKTLKDIAFKLVDLTNMIKDEMYPLLFENEFDLTKTQKCHEKITREALNTMLFVQEKSLIIKETHLKINEQKQFSL